MTPKALDTGHKSIMIAPVVGILTGVAVYR